ncbi:type II toxin-antitoxin system VapC family toxin [Candidatus Daviesbacteria bacterium]|nr:type II toxin-antitoxin system VapC family toxin [Candidatus Daviesbacteria bacterium]
MKKIVVDSSVMVKWLNSQNEDHLEQANKVLQDAEDGIIMFLAPELSRYEIGNALLKKKMDLSKALDTLVTAYNIPVQFVPETPQLALATYKIADEEKITYYDAAFLALAKQEEATLVTDNLKHQGKSSAIKVIALKDY